MIKKDETRLTLNAIVQVCLYVDRCGGAFEMPKSDVEKMMKLIQQLIKEYEVS